VLTQDYDLTKYPPKAINSRLGATLCECCGDGLDMSNMLLQVEGDNYGYVHPTCVGVTQRCDCCQDYLVGAKVRAVYTLPGFVIEHDYCSQSCKEEHRIQLIREAGL
jgi:hypothetical protein